jgi:hypothetical protein
MDLEGAHQEGLSVAKFVVSGCRTTYVNIAIYFLSSITFWWNTPPVLCLLSIDCYYLFMLINYNNGIKGSMCSLSHFPGCSCEHGL